MAVVIVDAKEARENEARSRAEPPAPRRDMRNGCTVLMDRDVLDRARTALARRWPDWARTAPRRAVLELAVDALESLARFRPLTSDDWARCRAEAEAVRHGGPRPNARRKRKPTYRRLTRAEREARR